MKTVTASTHRIHARHSLDAKVQELLDRAVAAGTESAVQVAAYWHGEMIVDAWAGPKGHSIDADSLLPIFSTGKGITATAIHKLAERGTLSLDVPIAQYWPEFAAEGKGGITLRHVLGHTVGLPMMPERGDAELAANWKSMCDFLAREVPLHAPGARRHYHAITYGWLLGETARRADGRSIDRIIADEVCRPLGINDLFFGVPTEALSRCVDAEKPLPVPPDPNAPPPSPPDPVAVRAIPPWVCPLEDWINQRVTRQACIPASNGFATARAIARHYGALVGTGVDGVRLLSDTALDTATRWTSADEAIPGGGRKAGGYALQGPDASPGDAIGHGGYGGSTGFADRRLGLAVAVVKSRMGGPITGKIVETIRSGILDEITAQQRTETAGAPDGPRCRAQAGTLGSPQATRRA